MNELAQQLLIGLTNGMIFALVALGYSMVYGVLELINFAHGDLFMLCAFFALTLLGLCDAQALQGGALWAVLGGVALASAAFGAALNWCADRWVYRRLRQATKLAPLVSAIGMSFIFQNLGLFWGGLPMQVFGGGHAAAAPKSFPDLLGDVNLLGSTALRFTVKDAAVVGCAVVAMAVLVGVVRYSRLGRAMRATAQDPVAARLMGIDVDWVIGATFAVGGGLAGFAAVIYGLYVNTVSYQSGYQNGLYAFTAAVLGGIGNIVGAVLGGLLMGVVRALSDEYVGGQWQAAVLFGLLIVILVFRPAGLLGNPAREKV